MAHDSRNHYHLIGIGGAGMSALARVLHARGVRVTGSDMAASPTLAALEAELGEHLYAGHSAEHVDGEPSFVVASAAIKPDNPELAEARRRGIPVISRARMLGQMMDLYPTRIAVSGTHGKTTTSAMAAQMLAHAGLDPTALIGADVAQWRSNTRIGASDVVVAEACEAYGSFLDIRPTHAIITNIEADHLDYYADFAAILDAFRQFARQTTTTVIACAESNPSAATLIAEAAGAKLLSYGIDDGDLTASDIDPAGRFVATMRGKPLGAVSVRVPGRHNISNALAVAALGISLELPFSQIAAGIAQFTGTSRRFELIAELPGGITVIDDYAHHPTEIQATLAAARSRYPGRRIVALFQPHLPSRTRDLMDEFAGAFGDADEVLITDIYLARETPMPGVSSETLAALAGSKRGPERVHYAGDLDHATRMLRGVARPGDVALTLGAGNVRKAGEALAAANALTAV